MPARAGFRWAPSPLFAAFRETTQKGAAILIVFKNGLAAVAAAHHMIEGAGKFNAGLSGHEMELPGEGQTIKNC